MTAYGQDTAAHDPKQAAQDPRKRASGTPMVHASTPLIDTMWQFMDASGATFTARFMVNGAFEGPTDTRLWRWDLAPAGLTIVFDNGMGTRIVRQGRFVDADWLNGEARTTDGRRWDWVARRVTDE